MHDRDQHHGDRLAEVEGPPRPGRDRRPVPQVGLNVVRLPFRAACQQGAGVADDQRVMVNVDDPRLRGGALRHVVRVVGGGQPGSDVKELADARRRQLRHRGGQEAPQHGRDQRQLGHRGPHVVPGLAVGAEVVLAADPVIPHPGRVGDAGVEAGERDAAAFFRGLRRILRHGTLLQPCAARAVSGCFGQRLSCRDLGPPDRSDIGSCRWKAESGSRVLFRRPGLAAETERSWRGTDRRVSRCSAWSPL